MTFKFRLSEMDYFKQYYYDVTNSKDFKKKKFRNWFHQLLYIIILCLFFSRGEKDYFVFSLYLIPVAFVIFLMIQNWHYKHQMWKNIDETYKNRFNEISTIVFKEDNLKTIHKDYESVVNFTAFDELTEVRDYFFLSFRDGGSFIFPKEKIENINELRIKLESIVKNYNLKYSINLKWK